MRDGDFERALDRFGAAWKESPGHPGVHYLYADAVGGLKKSGDDAFQRGQAEEAGRKWTGVLGAMGHPAVRGRALPFAKTELRAAVDRLTASLLEKALVKYREGKLEAAIALWRAILSYDPANEEASKSVRTATTQLENLKKMTAPK